MSQLGWSVTAPMLVEASEDDVPSQCLQHSIEEESDVTFVAFRLRLDGSFIDGEGQISLIVKDIDGLSSTETMTINFFHAAPTLTMPPMVNSTAGDRIEPVAYVSDLDGLTDVDCRVETLDNGTSLANVSVEPQVDAPSSLNGSLAFVFPTTPALANTTLSFTFTCIDSWGQSASVSSTVFVEAPPPCIDCKDLPSDENDVQDFELSARLVIGIALPLLLLFSMSVIVLSRRKKDDAPPLWAVEDTTPVPELDPHEPISLAEGSAIPEGWSSEAYHLWLEGDRPEGWNEEQWSSFVEEQLSFFSQIPSDVAEKV